MKMQRLADPLAHLRQHFQSGPSRLALIFGGRRTPFKVARAIVEPSFKNDDRSFAGCYIGLFSQKFLSNFQNSTNETVW